MATYRTYCLLCFLAFIFSTSCCQNSNEKMSGSNANNLIETKMKDLIEKEKIRINKLLQNFAMKLKPIEVIPSVDVVGALSGSGYQVEGAQVYCMIYIYEDQTAHEAANAIIAENQTQIMQKKLISSNGRLFFWGYTTAEDKNSEYVLNALASAFAGDE